MTIGWAIVALAGTSVRAHAVESTRPDVVLVTLDTCRADRIGAYGYGPARTPALDELAARGRRYDRAYSPVPLTIPAHGALFTGREPEALGLRTNGDGLRDTELTLAERMSDAGYVTAASVGAYVTAGLWGFDQGFDTYYDRLGTAKGLMAERPGDQVVGDILTWTAGVDPARPRFAWVHLYDAHGPHVAPDGSAGNPYDAEVAFIDTQIARLVQAFDGRPTVFVVVGDHGESLGEHGETEHGLFVYDSTQRVPYVISGPGIAPQRVDEPVSLVDVAPTLLAHLGLDPLPAAEGRVAPGTPAAPVRLESWSLALRFGLAPHRAVVHGDHKLVDVPSPELYDLVSDPGERRNLAEAEPERVAAMRELLGPTVGRGSDDPERPGDPAMLAQLGYVEAEPMRAAAVGAPRDAKDHMDLVTAVARADAWVTVGRAEDAQALLEEVHGDYPDVLEVTVRLAQVWATTRHSADALHLLRGALERRPESLILKEALASVLAGAGRDTEAADLWAEVAEARPDVPGIQLRAFVALVQTPRGADRAIRLGLAHLERAPHDSQMAGRVGVAMAQRGSLARALPLLERAGDAVPPVPEVRLFLARAADEAGAPVNARRLLEEELALFPTSVRAVLALTMMMERSGEWQAQLDLLDRALADIDIAQTTTGEGPETGLGLFWALKARALMVLQRYDEAREAVRRGMAAERIPELYQLAEALKRAPR